MTPVSYTHLSLEAELERLQTDHVDFVLLHRLDALCDLDELGDTMAHIVDSGICLLYTSVFMLSPFSKGYVECHPHMT